MTRRSGGFLGALASALLYGFPGAISPMIRANIASVSQRMRRPLVAIIKRYPSLNRSRHWPAAQSYKEACHMSPVPNNPVR